MVADTKKVQTFINAMGATIEAAQTIIDRHMALRTELARQRVDTAGTILAEQITAGGQTMTVAAWMDALTGQARQLIQHPALQLIKANVVASHRGTALDG